MARIVLSVLLSLFGSAAASSIVSLTPDTFDAATTAPPTLVLFFDRNCPISKALFREWTLVPRLLPPTNLTLAQLDCTDHHSFCDTKAGVRGFPHVRLYKPEPQRPAEFAGARTTVGIARFARSQLRPASLPLLSRAQMKHELKWDRGRVIAVAWLGPEPSVRLRSIWRGATEHLRNHQLLLAHSATPGVLGTKAQAAVTVISPGERKVKMPLRVFSSWRLQRWLRARSVPTWGELRESNYLAYSMSGVPLGLIFTGSHDICTMDPLAMQLVARSLRGRISLAHVPLVAAGVDERLSHSRQTPWFAVRQYASSPVLRSSGGELVGAVCDANEIRLAAGRFLEGRSSPLEMIHRGPGHPYPITQAAFEDVVLDQSKDVLLLVHAGWHTASRTALSALWKVAQATEFVESALVVEMMLTASAEAEEPLPASLEAFTFDQMQLLLFTSGNNTVHHYKGSVKAPRAAEILKFFRLQAQKPIKIEPKELLLLRQLKTVDSAGKAARAALMHNRRLSEMASALRAELAKKEKESACFQEGGKY